MRIAHLLRIHVAVLVLAAVSTLAYSFESLNQTLLARTKRSSHLAPQWIEEYLYTHNQSLKDPGKYLSPRDNQVLLRHETKNRSGVDCCPSVQEMVEPEGGMNQDDQYVELYRDGNNRQRFYELSCHKDIEGKPCRFMDRRLHNQSRCVQKYSYTYALVKDPGGGNRGQHSHQRPSPFPSFPSAEPGGPTWTLDYIRVRSGCSCIVTPNLKRKKNQKSRKRNKHEPSGD
ncbi:uncharacterized protein LOC108732850 [Agrilus planipennis]|uniref:Uncharacterized protein LOC108732850 n=1 Tax=Agrilus planipennis TaxID=224129 RepID=A0A1W4WH49_AGRPL|nr:uncharacterized protein LOC108732850 [Agrilus planipennis]XP_018319339.1 uncharacterized protein LOC108732850 [Agrilus planipennis]XP_018319340.1 uncharacterized protein LOC108732850 [Agrilus planipennis]XP_018319341.1 uncharacterized protein LOC108732850 [Agrilus planipennis]XP_018319342.1 uncharacterized protein LOC108732850 [Agrilus planipennis]XP_018319343.1 uncharacterized protein LOC108732850 [Agrilus planipennis]